MRVSRGVPMDLAERNMPPWAARITLAALFFVPVIPFQARAQGRAGDEATIRGDRAELTITVRDTGGQVFSGTATVRLYHSGILNDQSATSKGRAFFILNNLGDYTIAVEAPGYKSAQKDVSIRLPIKVEEDVYLVSESAPESGSDVPGKPLLAPKAKESLDKAVQELRDEKLDEAEHDINEAIKLAPSNPDVLYVQGVIYMHRRNWAKAQGVLEKVTQLEPAHARGLAALGMALANQGKYDLAIAPLERCLQLAPADWETQWTLAKAYYHHEQYDAALKASQDALTESHGAAPQIALLVAQSLTAVGRYEDAGRTLRDFLKDHPEEPGAATARRWLDRLAADGKIRRN